MYRMIGSDKMRRMPIAGLLLLLCLLLTAVPHAQASELVVSDVEIVANVNPDGSLHVIESRTCRVPEGIFDIDWKLETTPASGFTGAYTINSLNAGGVLLVRSDALPVMETPAVQTPGATQAPTTPGTDPTGEAAVTPVDLPVASTYTEAIDKDGDCHLTLRSKWAGSITTLTLDYTVTGFVKDWSDCAEMTWCYIDDSWASTTDKVSMTLMMPVPEDETVELGDNVRAWPHGANGTEVRVNSNNMLVFETSGLDAKTFTAAHLVFPTSWFTEMQPASNARLANILAQEQEQTTEEAHESILNTVMLAVDISLPVFAVLICFLYFLGNGREYRPDFHGEYYRGAIGPYHPAVLGRLWRFDVPSTTDITSTLMSLTRYGFVNLAQLTATNLAHVAPENLCAIERDPNECARLSDPIDRKVIEFMFDVCGQGADRMRFTDILRFSDDEPVLFNKKLRELQVAITEEVRDSELFEPKGDRARLRMTVLASALVAIGCVFIYLQQSFIPLVAFFTGAGLVVLISGRMPRRTRLANEVHARCEGMQRWFDDLVDLDEDPSGQPSYWADNVIHAHVLGASNQLDAFLKKKHPSFYRDPRFANLLAWTVLHDFNGHAMSMAAILDEVLGIAASDARSVRDAEARAKLKAQRAAEQARREQAQKVRDAKMDAMRKGATGRLSRVEEPKRQDDDKPKGESFPGN